MTEVASEEPVLTVDQRSPVLGGGTPGGLLGIVSVLRGPSELEGAIVDRGEVGRGGQRSVEETRAGVSRGQRGAGQVWGLR